MQTTAVLGTDDMRGDGCPRVQDRRHRSRRAPARRRSSTPCPRSQTVSTEAGISDGTGDGEKTTTTVGIDFGRVSLSGDMALYLFGTPGQERFDFMWDIVAKGMLGVIMLVDCQRPETFDTGAIDARVLPRAG